MSFSVYEVQLSQELDNGYNMYLVNCANGDVVLDLRDEPLSTFFYIKRVDTVNANTLTVNGNANLIQGQASRTVGCLQTLNIVRDSTQWVMFC